MTNACHSYVTDNFSNYFSHERQINVYFQLGNNCCCCTTFYCNSYLISGKFRQSSHYELHFRKMSDV